MTIAQQINWDFKTNGNLVAVGALRTAVAAKKRIMNHYQ